MKLFCLQSIVGPLTGAAFAILLTGCHRLIQADANALATVSIANSYATFFVADTIFNSSGILATVCLGFTTIFFHTWAGVHQDIRVQTSYVGYAFVEFWVAHKQHLSCSCIKLKSRSY